MAMYPPFQAQLFGCLLLRKTRLLSFLLQAEKENADPHPLEKSKKMATKAGKRTQP